MRGGGPDHPLWPFAFSTFRHKGWSGPFLSVLCVDKWSVTSWLPCPRFLTALLIEKIQTECEWSERIFSMRRSGNRLDNKAVTKWLSTSSHTNKNLIKFTHKQNFIKAFVSGGRVVPAFSNERVIKISRLSPLFSFLSRLEILLRVRSWTRTYSSTRFLEAVDQDSTYTHSYFNVESWLTTAS